MHVRKTIAACAAAGVTFVPIVMETLGRMSVLTVDTLASLGRLLEQRLGVFVCPENTVTYSAGNKSIKICGVFTETR